MTTLTTLSDNTITTSEHVNTICVRLNFCCLDTFLHLLLVNISEMSVLHVSALLACVGAAAAGQIPLQQSTNSQPAIDTVRKSGLISSTALQGDIDVEKLLYRAKELSKIADLGFDEYNHPTRVIGSKGTLNTCD